MAKLRQPGEAYWARINAAYKRVPIHASPPRFKLQFEKLDAATANLLAAHWCQSEVCDGGFYQFFANSTGILAPEAHRAFREIGALEWSEQVRLALSFFGPEYLRERSARSTALPPPIKGSRRSEWDPFFELDKEFYSWLKPDQDRWNKLADEYANAAAA